MVDVWTFDEETPHPIKTQCEVPGWPNKDITGQTMYENTHYATEEEAWAKLEAIASAAETHFAGMYRLAQERLDRATKELAERAAFAVDVRKARAARSKP